MAQNRITALKDHQVCQTFEDSFHPTFSFSSHKTQNLICYHQVSLLTQDWYLRIILHSYTEYRSNRHGQDHLPGFLRDKPLWVMPRSRLNTFFLEKLRDELDRTWLGRFVFVMLQKQMASLISFIKSHIIVSACHFLNVHSVIYDNCMTLSSPCM